MHSGLFQSAIAHGATAGEPHQLMPMLGVPKRVIQFVTVTPRLPLIYPLSVVEKMNIVIDDLKSSEIVAFLDEHINDMKSVSPPESKHALDLEELRSNEITFWSVYKSDTLIGCGALKELDSQHGEIKSMRTLASERGKGVASALLNHIITEATKRGYARISLETGSMPFFEPARTLYRKFGFIDCEPFSSYKKDPNSVFMTLIIKQEPNRTAHTTPTSAPR